MGWRIYYSPGLVPGDVIAGETAADWAAAPAGGVQIVIVDGEPVRPFPDRFSTGFCFCGWPGVTVYTGADEYDPLGFGLVKLGELLADAEYFGIWERARADCNP